jgi:hypothetical protein
MNEYQWTVRFTGDYFTLTTCVNAPNEERAIEYAKLLLKDHHGLDMNDAGAWDIEAETEGVWA